MSCIALTDPSPKPPLVVNGSAEPYDIYIGRGSKWGNPFHIGKHGTRPEVIRRYADWIVTQDALMQALTELDGKKLGCHCYPAPCHGDVLVELFQKKFLTSGGQEVQSRHGPQ